MILLKPNQNGQTLVALLAFMTMAITITTAATTVTLINSQAGSAYAQSQEAFGYAEAGAENALLRLLRDPSFSSETLSFSGGSATISVSGSTTKTIVSEGVSGSFRRKVQVTATHSNDIITVINWSEIP